MTSGPSSVDRAAYQTTTQSLVFRHSLHRQYHLSSALALCVPASPSPRFSCYFLSQGPFFGGGSTPQKMLSLAIRSCKGGRVVSEGTRLPASSLFLLLRASTQVLQFTFKESILEGNLRERTLHASLRSMLAARVDRYHDFKGEEWPYTKMPMTPITFWSEDSTLSATRGPPCH